MSFQASVLPFLRRLALTLPRLRHPGWLVALLLVGALALALQQHLFARSWFELQQWARSGQGHNGLWLPGYRVAIDGLQVQGIEGELSGLAYDPGRNILFSVTNTVPEVVELSLDGQLLRRIPLAGISDPEAIEYIAPHQFVISDERAQRLLHVQIDQKSSEVKAWDIDSLSLLIDVNGNKGFEGVTWDAASRRLLVAKERDPLRIYEIRGFPRQYSNQRLSVEVRENHAQVADLFVTDLSGLSLDPQSGHLLVLSEESSLLLELDDDGQPLSSLSLRAGQHGLRATIPHAEGVAVDNQGRIFMVSEPNLFYRFDPAPRQ